MNVTPYRLLLLTLSDRTVTNDLKTLIYLSGLPGIF